MLPSHLQRRRRINRLRSHPNQIPVWPQHDLRASPLRQLLPLNRRLWELAASLVPERRPGDFNQALMELGATFCSVRAPKLLALIPARR